MVRTVVLALLAVTLSSQQLNYTKQVKNKIELDVREYSWFRTNTAGASADLSTTGAKTITLTSCPYGVAGANSNHYVRIYEGTGTAEVALITGGTCTSGAASGTITLTTANTHTGTWKIGTATAGIQEAINALPASGGRVELPSATLVLYKGFTIPPYRSGVTVEGQGIKTTRIDVRSMGSGPVAKMTVGSANWLRKFSIGGLGAGSGMGDSDYAIVIDDQNSSGVEHVNIAEVPNGIHITSNTAVSGNYRLWVQYVDIGYLTVAGSTGILIEGGADHFLTQIAMGGMTNSLASIRIRKSGGSTIQNVDILSSGLLIDPDGAGNDVAWIFINAAMFDTTTEETFKIAPTNGAKVLGIVATNSWFASSENNVGVRIQSTAPSLVEDIVLDACRVINNATHGVVLDGDGVRKITLTSNIFSSNSRLSSGGYQGIWVRDASDLIISQNQIGQMAQAGFATHAAGIFFDAGDTDNIIVTDNIVTDASVTPILGLDTITGLNRIIKGNSGSSLAVVPVASANNIALGGEAYEHFSITGTTDVHIIGPLWYGRQITIRKDDAGTVNFVGGMGNIRGSKSLTTGEMLMCTYDIGGWTCVGP